MNRAETVRQALIWEAAAAKAKERATALRAQLDTEARAELAQQGTAPSWRLPDLATVSLSVSREAVYVADDVAFLDWVKTHRPEKVDTVEQVRPAFRDALLAAVTIQDERLIDTNGVAVAGLGIRPGGQPRSLSIIASREAREVLGDAADRVIAQVAEALGLPAPEVAR